jgi:hypothetical protein
MTEFFSCSASLQRAANFIPGQREDNRDLAREEGGVVQVQADRAYGGGDEDTGFSLQACCTRTIYVYSLTFTSLEAQAVTGLSPDACGIRALKPHCIWGWRLAGDLRGSNIVERFYCEIIDRRS